MENTLTLTLDISIENASSLRVLMQVMEILCKNEGTAVSSGLSTYFGDSEETLADATAREKTASALSPGLSAAPSGADGQCLADVLSPAEVG